MVLPLLSGRQCGLNRDPFWPQLRVGAPANWATASGWNTSWLDGRRRVGVVYIAWRSRCCTSLLNALLISFSSGAGHCLDVVVAFLVTCLAAWPPRCCLVDAKSCCCLQAAASGSQFPSQLLLQTSAPWSSRTSLHLQQLLSRHKHIHNLPHTLESRPRRVIRGEWQDKRCGQSDRMQGTPCKGLLWAGSRLCTRADEIARRT